MARMESSVVLARISALLPKCRLQDAELCSTVLFGNTGFQHKLSISVVPPRCPSSASATVA